ncbi:MAG: 6-phosphofructokinase [Anaerolineaceae bacterium]|nr:6-phosphofructokinase [Anaerolineaceae bacterium]
MDKQPSVAILCGGGPAPGINTVVCTITKTFITKGYRIIGLHGGYTGLFCKEKCRQEDMDFDKADMLFNRGGSYLRMSRFKPTDEDFEKRFNLDFFTENDVKLLVTVGGDDTASTANRISKFLVQKQYNIANIHVPKTIDNDLPLPEGIPTFGYQSAKAQGTDLGRTVYEDARTSENWFIVTAMGRSAGHLAFGIGSSCHFPMIIISEMFYKTQISIDKIVNLIVSSVIKRQIRNISYGCIMISEGVFQNLSEEDVKNAGIAFTYDAHGHPELGKISKSHIIDNLVEKKFKELGVKVKTRPVEVGYEVRCITPKSFDLEYCSMLGMGVYELFTKGVSGCMVCRDGNGKIIPLFLQDLQDPATGKIPPRIVNMKSQEVQFYMKHIMDYITEEDYEAAKAIVPNPGEFDFHKILKF